MGFMKFLDDVVFGKGKEKKEKKADQPEMDEEAVKAEIKSLIDSGRKIEAIKVVREAYGYGLKEAKDIVENME